MSRTCGVFAFALALAACLTAADRKVVESADVKAKDQKIEDHNASVAAKGGLKTAAKPSADVVKAVGGSGGKKEVKGAAETSKGNVVIGKQAHLDAPGTVQPGERKLDLPNLHDPKANWTQNSTRLRQAMSQGKPIRDASAQPLVNGKPGNDTGFLKAERNELENKHWSYRNGYWYPPAK